MCSMYPSHTLSVDFAQDWLPQDIAKGCMKRGMMCRSNPSGTTPCCKSVTYVPGKEPFTNGGSYRIRTYDHRVKSPVLYQLS